MKNFLTFRQLDTACLHKAGLNENDVIPALRVVLINDKLMRVYRLLDGLNDPWYHKTTTLSAAADTSFVKDAGGVTTLSAVDQTLKTLTRTAGTWKLGDLLIVSFYNGTTGARVCDFTARIVGGQGTATCTYSVIAGTDTGMTLTGTKYTVTIPGGSSTSTLDLTGLYVKDILKIYDNAYVGGKIRIYSPVKDPNIFAVLHRDPFYDARIAYFHRGDTIDLYTGATATALGTIQFEYRGKPALCTDFDTDAVIDIPPEDNQMLMDETLVEYLMAAKKDIPAELQARHVEFQKRYEAAAADAQKTIAEVKGVRS